MKVLVVEDDAETSAYVARGLKEQGHGVEVAANGRDGLFLALDQAYDVVIMDRMLPGMDGLSLVKSMRAGGMETPVIFLTALGGGGGGGGGAGARDFFEKAFLVLGADRGVQGARAAPADEGGGGEPGGGRPRA